MIYLKEIIVLSKNAKKHLQNIETVHSLLQTAGLTMKLMKCFFTHKQIDYLGHIVKPKEIYVAPKKIYAVQQMFKPNSNTQLRPFPGVCNVYQRIVNTLASIAIPLNNQLSKTVRE